MSTFSTPHCSSFRRVSMGHGISGGVPWTIRAPRAEASRGAQRAAIDKSIAKGMIAKIIGPVAVGIFSFTTAVNMTLGYIAPDQRDKERLRALNREYNAVHTQAINWTSTRLAKHGDLNFGTKSAKKVLPTEKVL